MRTPEQNAAIWKGAPTAPQVHQVVARWHDIVDVRWELGDGRFWMQRVDIPAEALVERKRIVGIQP